MFYDRKQNLMSLLYSNHQESVIVKLINNYLANNPITGYIVFQVFQESQTQGRQPIPNARITLSKYLGEGYFISQIIMTNSDGKTDPIPLPTPGNNNGYATYNARIEAPDFLTTEIIDFKVFDEITGNQAVILQPKEGNEVQI
ncbi:MAG: hypothetical protein PHE29_09775 [Tissierellia bacterium]|nr:hypothetical protein [Tissierellia bacterium]